MALAGKKALIKGSGGSLTFEDETFSTEDNKNYLIDDENKQVWDRTAEIKVYEDGTETTEEFKVNRLIGSIIFKDEDVGRGTITADGEYLPMQVIAEAFEYNYTLSADNVEKNAFANEYIKREQTILDITGNISRWYELDHYFSDILLEDEGVFFVEFYSFYEEEEAEEPDILAWIKLNTDEISGVVDGLVEENVSFEGTHDIDNRTATSL